MFCKTKKILFGFLAFATLLFVVGCQNQTTDSKAQNTSPQESWEWTEQPLTMQKILLAMNIKTFVAAYVVEDFNDVKMTLDINENTVELKYHLSVKKVYEDEYKGLQLKTPDMDTYVKNNFDGFKEAVKKYQHAQVTTDDANLAYDYSLKGEIDKEKHTITFPETPTFLKALVMGIGIDPLKPITYNYTVDGNQMTLFIEGDIQEGYPREMRIRFNRLGGQ